MSGKKAGPTWGGVGDEAVRAKTGKGWDEWLERIDAAGGRKMTHQERVKIVRTEGVGPWWEQMITVGYEQARGLRKKHERSDGFQISRSRTFPVAVKDLLAAFGDGRRRSVWLGEKGLKVRSERPGKGMRIPWKDGRSVLDISFQAKGAGKSTVTIQHEKLRDAREAARMKEYWGEKLDALGTYLTS
jgi:hypothetical protein